MKLLEVLVCSASRPRCLADTVESFAARLGWSGEMRWLLHEDVVRRDPSGRVLSWARASGRFAEIIETAPARRHGRAIASLLARATQPIVFRLEDDWRLIADVDLGPLVELMEFRADIDQIQLHKHNRSGPPDIAAGSLHRAHEWGMAPGLWRTETARRMYSNPGSRGDECAALPCASYLIGGGPHILHLGHGDLYPDEPSRLASAIEGRP